MLTNEQLLLIKAEIDGDPALSALPDNSDGAFAIAQALNQLAIPDFYVWRTEVGTDEIRSVLVWAEYDALSASKQNAFAFLCSNHIVDASLPNVRQGIGSIFSGPGQSGNLAALIDIGKRKALRIEKVLATGTGSQGSPATMTYEGTIRYQDVEAARRL